MAYFERIGPDSFLPTRHTGGAWNPKEQHIAPAIGLLAHVLELDCKRRGLDFKVGRLSYDILGPIPLEPMVADVQVIRPGRTIELVECSLSHQQRPALRLRAWLMQSNDTDHIAGTHFPVIEHRENMPPWDPTSIWPGDFIKSVEVRRILTEPGRATYWARSLQPLLDGEPVSPFARAVGLFDLTNGMAVRAAPREIAFPNLDLTAHLFGEPTGEWLGFDTRVSFGTNGLGLTSSIIHDEGGPIGIINLTLTVRP